MGKMLTVTGNEYQKVFVNNDYEYVFIVYYDEYTIFKLMGDVNKCSNFRAVKVVEWLLKNGLHHLVTCRNAILRKE